MAKDNGQASDNDGGDEEETNGASSRLLKEGPERNKAAKELFKNYLEAREARAQLNKQIAAADENVSIAVQEIYEILGVADYVVKNETLTPVKRKVKGGVEGDFSYYMKGKTELKTEVIA